MDPQCCISDDVSKDATYAKLLHNVKKIQAWSHFLYFGHNLGILSPIEMKLLGFFQTEDIYKSVREDHCPFMLGFVRNYKLVVFKYMGPNHWQKPKIS
jgi:hypothetical protein